MFNPQQFQMAQEMMKNMSPEQMQNIMKMAQDNPHLVQQARNMMNNQQYGNASNTQQNIPSQNLNQKQLYEDDLQKISDLKQKGNTQYKDNNLDIASAIYIEAILDIDQFRKKYSDVLQRDNSLGQKIDKLEIDLRNNYCTTKRKCQEEEYMLDHCDRVLKIDNKNFKALYNMILAYKSLNNKESELFYINKALQYYPKQSDLLYLKEEATQNKKKDQEIYQQETENKEAEQQKIEQKETEQEEDNKQSDYEKYFNEEANQQKELQKINKIEQKKENENDHIENQQQNTTQNQKDKQQNQKIKQDIKQLEENLDFDINEEEEKSQEIKENIKPKNIQTQGENNKIFQQNKSEYQQEC